MKTNKNTDFYRKLFSIVIPIAFQQLMLNLVSASDAYMLGFVGQDELSAVSLAGQVQFVFSLFLAAITIGTGIFAAQYYGKGDIISIEKIFSIALKITIPVSSLFTILTIASPAYIIHLFTSDKILIAKGAEYLRLAGISYFFCGISQIYICILKNISQAKKATLISSACAIFDAVMNAIFIFGLLGFSKMEIAGAAISTSIARLVECVWVIIELTKLKPVRIRATFRKTDKVLLQDFWKHTTPVLCNELVWGIGFTMYTVIMGHLGSDAVAANSIANISKNLVVCFCMGLGSGGGILIGNELGAGNLTQAKEYGSQLCKASIIFGIISGGVLLSISPLIIKLVTLSSDAKQYLWWMLILSSIYMVGKSINVMTIAGIFCAGGDSKFGFLCDTITLWCITVPLGLISAFVLKLPVVIVYMIINTDEILKLPAVYRHYKKYKWLKDLTH